MTICINAELNNRRNVTVYICSIDKTLNHLNATHIEKVGDLVSAIVTIISGEKRNEELDFPPTITIQFFET